MLKLVCEHPNAIDFYFTENDNEYDMCLRRYSNYYLLYLNHYEYIHNDCDNVAVFIDPLNEMLNLLPYIDGFNEHLDIYIAGGGFNEHNDLINYLLLEKQDFKMFGDDIYLVKKGR